jgi:hypothetical protein
MNIRYTIPFFVAWVLVLGGICLGYAFGEPSVMYSGPMWMWILVYGSNKSQKMKMSSRQKWGTIVVVAVIISLIIWGAATGYNEESNKHFNNSVYRPYFGLGWFVLYLACGFSAFRRGREQQENLGDPSDEQAV